MYKNTHWKEIFDLFKRKKERERKKKGVPGMGLTALIRLLWVSGSIKDSVREKSKERVKKTMIRKLTSNASWQSENIANIPTMPLSSLRYI